jgi:thiamine biosynthesis lipoprotein
VAGLRFRAMGTDCHVIAVGGPPHLEQEAVARVEDLEDRWSRFRPDSEVSRLNRAAGEPLAVSPETRLLVGRAREGWRLTGGGFDPLVLRAVIGAGYREDLDVLLAREDPVGADLARGLDLLACTDIRVEGDTVQLPAGSGFDPGGIGKGLAADLVVEELLAGGADGACVNLGGDLRVAGRGPEGAWTVDLEHPEAGEPVARLGLRAGAVATSTTLRRRWPVRGGGEHHHLIDPITGAPSTTDLTMASVVADAAWVAEVMAKAVLLRGSVRAFDIVPADIDALTVDVTGAVQATERFGDYLGGSALPRALAVPARDHER